MFCGYWLDLWIYVSSLCFIIITSPATVHCHWECWCYNTDTSLVYFGTKVFFLLIYMHVTVLFHCFMTWRYVMYDTDYYHHCALLNASSVICIITCIHISVLMLNLSWIFVIRVVCNAVVCLIWPPAHLHRIIPYGNS